MRRRSERARSSSCAWNISGVTATERVTFSRFSSTEVSTPRAKAPSAVSALPGCPTVISPRTAARCSAVGNVSSWLAMIGSGEDTPSSSRETLSGSVNPPVRKTPDKAGKFAASCAASSPGTSPAVRSPGAMIATPSVSRSSTFGSDIAATTREAASRSSKASSPLISRPPAAPTRSRIVGAVRPGTSGMV